MYSASSRVGNGMKATTQGPIKTFPLRGIKESPPYFHDGRLLTLEDVVEFFNLILETQLTGEEKKDLVEFLKSLTGQPPPADLGQDTSAK